MRLFISMVSQSGEDMRQVRLRLAACRVTSSEEMASQRPGEKRNLSSSRHVSPYGSHFLFPASIFVSLPEMKGNKYFPLCIEQKSASHINEEEEEAGDAQSFTNHHECLLVKQVSQHSSRNKNEKVCPDF